MYLIIITKCDTTCFKSYFKLLKFYYYKLITNKRLHLIFNCMKMCLTTFLNSGMVQKLNKILSKTKNVILALIQKGILFSSFSFCEPKILTN